MAVSHVSKIKMVVLSADGTKFVLTPAEFARVRMLPGMKVGVLDESTGQAPKGLKAKAQGKDLLLELPEHGLLAKVEGFEELSDFSFVEDINTITTAQNTGVVYAQASAPTPVATDAGAGAAGTPADKAATTVPASGTAISGFSMSSLGLALGGLALAAAGGGGGGNSITGNNNIPTTGAQVIDGYLVGSTVTRLNGSGNSVTTDANGFFTGLTGTGAIKVTGGRDSSTGQEFKGTLTSPADSKVVTPITTLIQKLSSDGSVTVTAATAQVLSKLGLDATFDVLNVDPLALANSNGAGSADALAVFKAGVMVATALQVLSGGDGTNFSQAVTALANLTGA